MADDGVNVKDGRDIPAGLPGTDGHYRPISKGQDSNSGHINLGADFTEEHPGISEETNKNADVTNSVADNVIDHETDQNKSEHSYSTTSTSNDSKSSSKFKVQLRGSKPDIVRCSKRAPDAPSSSGSGASGSTRRRALSFGSEPHWLSKFLKDEKPPLDRDEVHSGTKSDNGVWLPDAGTDSIQSKDTEAGTDRDAWRLALHEFTSKRQGSKRKAKSVPPPVRSYYKRQDELIDQYKDVREGKDGQPDRSYYKSQDELIDKFEEIRLDLDDAMENAEYLRKLRKKASLIAKITFFVNFLLLLIKITAVVLSGSISLISSLVDSAVDLLSGIVIWLATRAVKRTDRYIYPQGRTKLEPIAIVILAVIMASASVQVIKEATTKIVGLVDQSTSPPVMTAVPVSIACATVVIKLVLFLVCRRIPHPTIQALAQDHRNDVLSNTVAVIFGYIGSQQALDMWHVTGLVYLDPVGAIIICVYIIVSWCILGWGQIKLLVGHTATPEFISKLTWLAVDHHKKVQKVDTVTAFHFGNNCLVEVDIVLPPEMTLREAHDIAEPLQAKLERLPEVERAFVHADYEYSHKPKMEHKRV